MKLSPKKNIADALGVDKVRGKILKIKKHSELRLLDSCFYIFTSLDKN